MRLIKQIFTQEMHSAGSVDDEPRPEIELVDAGAGEYAVISANHWSMNDAADVDELAAAIKHLLKGALG